MAAAEGVPDELSEEDYLSQADEMLELQENACNTWLDRIDGTPIRKRDMDKLVMNFLVTEGYVEAAETFQKELDGEFLEPSILEKLASLKNHILEGHALEAINQVNEWYPEILKSNVPLHAGLVKQNVFELLCADNTHAALDYAEEVWVPLVEKDARNRKWAESTMMLFLYEDMRQSPDYGTLSDRMRIAKDLINSILASEGRDKNSKLPNFLKMLKYIQWEVWWCPRIRDMSKPFVFDWPQEPRR